MCFLCTIKADHNLHISRVSIQVALILKIKHVVNCANFGMIKIQCSDIIKLQVLNVLELLQLFKKQV